ncbi:MAG: DctP family TRAP transporter solute-binding subunit [Synergistaceae bacterium]|nr:DctP family TRAP transporter solute-binding subunit [Synergistaceae bacterium]
MKKTKSFISCATLTLALMVLLSASAMAAETYVIRVASIQPETHPDLALIKTVFEPYVEEHSNGRIKVEIYANAQMGGDREYIEGIQLGTLQWAATTTSVLGNFEPGFNVVEMPYLFTSREAAFKALDGKLGKELDKRLPKLGMINLGYIENGFRHVTNNKRPINSAMDLKGLKIRTMEVPAHISFFKRLGANPTPMNFGELYTALQQGTVDGQENPLVLISDCKLNEVQKYCSLTGHIFSVCVNMFSKKFYDSLPDDLKKVIDEAAARYVAEHRMAMERGEIEVRQALEKQGMKINDLLDKDKKAFVEAGVATLNEYSDKIGNDIVELAKSYINN